MFKPISSKPGRKAARGAAVAAGLLAAVTTTAATIVPASATTRAAASVSQTPPKGSVNIFGLNRAHIKLSGQVLSNIYQGKITEWDDPAIAKLNPTLNLPADKIIAIHRSDSSGDTFLFSSYLSAADPKGWGQSISYGTSIGFPSLSNALGETGNGGMVTGCAATPGCIAYIGISYLAKTQSDGLGEAMLQNASGKYLLPTPATMVAEAKQLEAKTPANETLSMIFDKASNGYPIVNYEYAIVPPKELNGKVAQAVRAFLAWAVDPKNGSASSFLNQVDFQPLTPAVAALSDAQIAQITG